MLFASPLSEFGLKFGPRIFWVMFMGLSFVIYLSRGVIKGIMMGAFGLVISCIGLITSMERLG